MPLGALPSSSSILGNTPGASGRQRRPQGGAPSQPPSGQQQPSQQPQQPQQPQTFAQMQQSGRARPAPPRTPAFQPPLTARPGQPAGPSSSQGLQSPLQQSLRQSLANPNPYNSDTVQQINAGLTGQINQDYGAQRKHLEEDLARRGLSASTIGGGYYGDLQGQQDQALATMRAGLIQQSANAELQGRSSAQGAAQSNINAANQQGLSEQQLELSRQLGLGNLNLQQGSLTGNLNGQSTLGAQQLAQSGTQFNRQQQLAEQMGLGNLGINQGQLALAQTGQAQQYGLSRDQLALQQQLGVGNLGISQGQLDLARTGQAQDYGLAKNAQNIQQQQFGQTFGLSQQQQDLARTLGLGNLDVSRQQLAQQGSQFGQDLALRSKQNDQQYGLQSTAQQDARTQFAQQLAQQLGLATMSDKTANRGIDANASQQQLDYLLRLAGITGIGGLGGGSGSNPYGIGAGGTGTQGYGNYTGSTTGNGQTDPATGKPYVGSGQSSGGSIYDQINNAAYNNSPNRPTNYQTINFGGQQYTPQQFEQLKQQHPELFGVHNPTNNGNESLWAGRTFGGYHPNPNFAQQYQGTPEVSGPNGSDPNNPFDPAWQAAHPNATMAERDAAANAHNFNSAQNDASRLMQGLINAGGLFTDTMPSGTTLGQSTMQGMQSTQQWYADQLKKAGFNPDGTRYTGP